MQITYSVTPDDVAAVYAYNWKHAPRVRRKLFLFAALLVPLPRHAEQRFEMVDGVGTEPARHRLR